MLTNGNVTKIADDLYCGADDITNLIETWRSVLEALAKCDLRLSPSKTVICPSSTIILGWMYSQGNLSATKHPIATLSSCDPPVTVKGLRSFIGTYKVLSRVIKGCSNILAPLDRYVAGRGSAERLTWTEDLQNVF